MDGIGGTRTGYLVKESRDEVKKTPLVELSQSMPRMGGVVQSDTGDDFDIRDRYQEQSRPLFAKDIRSGSSVSRMLKQGGIGRFFFGTSIGWRVYLGLLVFWVGGCQFGLVLMNRFILLTGTYK